MKGNNSMDLHTVSEISYKNGQSDGYVKAQKKEKVEWVIIENYIVCGNCGTKVTRYDEVKSLEAVSQHRFCHWCGCCMFNNLTLDNYGSQQREPF